jgi:phospholipase C
MRRIPKPSQHLRAFSWRTWLGVAPLLLACQSTPTTPPAGSAPDPADIAALAAWKSATPIRHVVVIVEENHTFDSYFGRYCTGAAGVSCTTGPSCCEAAPTSVPALVGTQPPLLLDAMSNIARDRNHESQCELDELHWDGTRYLMDRFVYGAGPSCSIPENFAIVDPAKGTDDTGVTSVYWGLAQKYALADRFFQPTVGSTSSNDMFLATAQFHFVDNQAFPQTLGTDCQLSYYNLLPPPARNPPPRVTFENTTIADLLIESVPGLPFGHYHQGYQSIHDAAKNGTLDKDQCPPLPSDCTIPAAKVNAAACSYDPSDNPFRYFSQFADGSLYAQRYLKDLGQLPADIAAGGLPAVSFVKALTYTNEHPAWSHIYEGTALVQKTVDQVLTTQYGETIDGKFVPYADSTLVLLTWDEGGGFFDHIPPPRSAPVDGRPYGTRVPMLAIGKFAKKNYVSHVQLEHSSIVKFLEWNFLGKKSGQLSLKNKPTQFGTAKDLPRDALVNNVGDLLDPAQTQVPIPSGTSD